MFGSFNVSKQIELYKELYTPWKSGHEEPPNFQSLLKSTLEGHQNQGITIYPLLFPSCPVTTLSAGPVTRLTYLLAHYVMAPLLWELPPTQGLCPKLKICPGFVDSI